MLGAKPLKMTGGAEEKEIDKKTYKMFVRVFRDKYVLRNQSLNVLHFYSRAEIRDFIRK